MRNFAPSGADMENRGKLNWKNRETEIWIYRTGFAVIA
jgi:hypothetical protein